MGICNANELVELCRHRHILSQIVKTLSVIYMMTIHEHCNVLYTYKQGMTYFTNDQIVINTTTNNAR